MCCWMPRSEIAKTLDARLTSDGMRTCAYGEARTPERREATTPRCGDVKRCFVPRKATGSRPSVNECKQKKATVFVCVFVYVFWDWYFLLGELWCKWTQWKMYKFACMRSMFFFYRLADYAKRDYSSLMHILVYGMLSRVIVISGRY